MPADAIRRSAYLARLHSSEEASGYCAGRPDTEFGGLSTPVASRIISPMAGWPGTATHCGDRD